METSLLRRFAVEARKVFLQGVSQRLTAVGFNLDGSYVEEPVLHEGGAVFSGKIETEDFYHKWKSLQRAVASKSVREVIEEAAYTWFNRFVAIRILEKNGFISPVLEYESEDIHVPIIVTDARQGRLPQMNEDSLEKINALLQDDSKKDEQFSMLIVEFCHSNPIISKCFGRIADYTELLLPQNILANGGFVDMINHTEFLTDEDYRSPELIGWLYQFYISERKDEVFAKKGKVEADEIPAATQIFTPNWIVKYMVQNTVGRIYLDNCPDNADQFRHKWKYLVEPSEPTPANAIYRYDDLTELRLGDLACGSGHILNEFFDLLFELYQHEGYTRQKAIENIFTKNIIGIDIDTRAKQLATFALLLKACQRDHSYTDAHCMPRIYDMPEPYDDEVDLRDTLPHFLLGGNSEIVKELIGAIRLMDDANTLGSIMRFDISECTRNIVAVRVEEYEQLGTIPEPIEKLMPYMKIILALTEKYSALVMNPPYMGSGKMNETLSSYAKNTYPIAKGDLYAMFIEHSMQLLSKQGRAGLITMESWMFLPSFEKLRVYILKKYHISSMGHLGWHIIGIEFGTVMTIFEKNISNGRSGEYSFLTIKDIDREKNVPFIYPKKNNGRYAIVSQQNFDKIPGCPIGYWVSEKMIKCFDNTLLKELGEARSGVMTGNSPRFVKYFFEVSHNKIGFNHKNQREIFLYGKKWFPIVAGGSARKWYGNLDSVVNLEDGGKEIQENSTNFRLRDPQYYFKRSITWSKISSDITTFRLCPTGVLFGDSGLNLFISEDLEVIMSLMNSKVITYLLKLINPTLNNQVSDIGNIPLPFKLPEVTNIVAQVVSISKEDWDAHETSWDYEINELVKLRKHTPCVYVTVKDPQVDNEVCTLESFVGIYKETWEKRFMEIHANEVELNRQFIEIYGLQDELSPDVPFKKITILQQGEISIVDGKNGEEIRWNDDVIVKQLISYAMGCMMGRYSIDKPGLILANQGDGMKEYKELVPDSRFEVDDDGIVPLMSNNTELTDNATMRFKQWMSVTFGDDNIVVNMNYVEKCLGKTVDEYFVRDFWKDHKKMYQNRPIYWLFASKKNAFQCLVYMHRMDAYTVERIRSKYLLPHIEWLVAKQKELQAGAANLSAQERRELDSIARQITECREYHERLHVVADEQISFDLDDGVVVNYAKFGDVLVKMK